MKKTLLTSIVLAFFLLFSNTETKAQNNKLLHYWHFNNTLPLSGGGGIHLGTSKMNSDYTKPSLTVGYLRFIKVSNCLADTGYWDNLIGDSINQRVGYGACCPVFGSAGSNSAVRTRNPNDSMQFLWYIPTTKFKNIKLTWESMSSSTASGPHRMNYSYSLDSGATFITSNLPQLFDSAGTAWGKITLNLSAITTINNNNKLMLRIKLGAPNTGSSGNNRYDNITVEGDSIISIVPTGIKSSNRNSSGYDLYPNPSTDIITISTPFVGQKNIVVTNFVGQTVFVSKQDDKYFPIDVSQFNNGIYFVRISDQQGENKSVMKFVKD